ncbi:MAG TPA: hypothetical protein PKC98_13660 [Candidatus Melainabacteria bacterium]|nr:hypothetical protein [Candidatus Melainabacteria bacterium]
MALFFSEVLNRHRQRGAVTNVLAGEVPLTEQEKAEAAASSDSQIDIDENQEVAENSKREIDS